MAVASGPPIIMLSTLQVRHSAVALQSSPPLCGCEGQRVVETLEIHGIVRFLRVTQETEVLLLHGRRLVGQKSDEVLLRLDGNRKPSCRTFCPLVRSRQVHSVRPVLGQNLRMYDPGIHWRST